MVASTLIGISAISGVPLFTRHIGPGKPPPYALVASLNGVHVFGDAQGVTLWKAASEASTVIWKTFHNSIRLILIHGNETSGEFTDHILLDLAFNSLVLLNGLQNIISQNNDDRLKKDLRICYSILDELLLRSMGCKEEPIFSHLTKCVDYVMPPDQWNIQPELDKFLEGLDCSYGCLMLGSGRVLFASRSFWSLSGVELALLSALLSCSTRGASVSVDIPIYLPNKSADVPFRFVSVCLAGRLSIVVLCGAQPSLAETQRSAVRFWTPHFLALDAVVAAACCSLPVVIRNSIDKSILGMLVMNYSTRRCVSCMHARDKSDSLASSRGVSPAVRAALLATAYRTLFGVAFPPLSDDKTEMPIEKFEVLKEGHKTSLSCIILEEWKVVALARPPHHLFLLFPALLPTHIAREVTYKTMDLLTKNKATKI